MARFLVQTIPNKLPGLLINPVSSQGPHLMGATLSTLLRAVHHITKSWWCICGLERHSITWDRVPLQTRHFPLNSSLSELHRYVSTRNLITAILSAQFPLSLNDDGRTAFGRVMLVGGEHVWDVDGNMVSRDSSSQTKKSNEKEYHYVWRETKHTREKSPARLSPQLPRRRESKRGLISAVISGEMWIV